MKLSEYAKLHGVTYRTVWNMYKNGKLKNCYQLPSGTIMVKEDNNISINTDDSENKIVCYSRVSSSENKSNLDSQEQRLLDFCAAKGYVVYKSIKEVGSGVNDSRPKLMKILNDPTIKIIVIEHKDRLTRFGFNYINIILTQRNGKIEVINNMDTKQEDLIQDFISIITSFCARIYGKRRTKRKTEEIIKELQNK